MCHESQVRFAPWSCKRRLVVCIALFVEWLDGTHIVGSPNQHNTRRDGLQSVRVSRNRISSIGSSNRILCSPILRYLDLYPLFDSFLTSSQYRHRGHSHGEVQATWRSHHDFLAIHPIFICTKQTQELKVCESFSHLHNIAFQDWGSFQFSAWNLFAAFTRPLSYLWGSISLRHPRVANPYFCSGNIFLQHSILIIFGVTSLLHNGKTPVL